MPQEEKERIKKEKGTRVPEEIEKALQCVALMIAIQGAKAQGEEEEERVEMFQIALLMMIAVVGAIATMQKMIPLLLCWLERPSA